MLIAYVVARRHWAPKPDELQLQRRKVVWFGFGLLALEVAADWPIHDIGEQFLLSAHMLQHLIMTFVAPALLLLGLPAAVLRGLLQPRFVRWSFSRLARPLPAAVLFNTVVAVSHWPAMVDLALRHEPVHFAVHVKDRQLAGGIMKVLGAGLLWVIIAVMFFRWYGRTEREKAGVLRWCNVERQLHATPPPAPEDGVSARSH